MEIKYPNGKLKELKFISNERPDSLVRFNENGTRISKREFVLDDTLLTVYHQNGKPESKGIITNDSLKSGWWEYYGENGNLISKRDYFIRCDDYYLNQSVIFDKKGDTIYKDDDFNETIFFSYQLKETDKERKLFYRISPISYRSKLELVLMTNNDFCNEEDNIDTVIPLQNRTGTIPLDKSLGFKTGFVFDYYIDTLIVDGEKELNAVSRKIYFSNDTD